MCYLRYRLQFINNDILPCNVLLHLLNCPRSELARSDCRYCSPLPPPDDNLKYQPDFYTIIELLYRKVSPMGLFNDSALPLFERYSIKQFNLNLSFKSREYFEVVNSEQKRYLEMFVCDSPCMLLLAYCEVFLRILLNFFWSVSDDFKDGRKRFFLDACICFVKELFQRVTPLMNSSFFETMFLICSPDVNYSTRYIRIINDRILMI